MISSPLRSLSTSKNGCAVGRSVSCDCSVAELTGQRGLRVVARALLQVGLLDTGDHDVVDPDRAGSRCGRSDHLLGHRLRWSRSVDDRRRVGHGVAARRRAGVGHGCRRRRRHRASWSCRRAVRRTRSPGVLGPCGLDPGAPQLVGDETEHEQARRDQRLAEPTDPPPPVVRGGGRSNLRTRPGSGCWLRATSDTSIEAQLALDATRSRLANGFSLACRHVRGRTHRGRGGARFVPGAGRRSITIDEGDIVLLRGPNGAGKTTLLRLCAGLVPIVRGTGRILGLRSRHATRGDPPARRCARPSERALPRPDGRREHPLLGRHGRARSRRDLPRWTGSAWPTGSSTCPSQTVGGPEATYRARLSRCPTGAAVAARRTACRPRCHAPRRTRRHPSSGGGRRRHDRRREPRTRARRVVGHRARRRRRRSRPRGRRPSQATVVSLLAHRSAGRRARICASNGTAASSPTRCCRSPA